MSAIGNWRNCKSYADRQKAYTERTVTASSKCNISSGENSSGDGPDFGLQVQGYRLGQKPPVTPATTGRTRQAEKEKDDELEIDEDGNPLTLQEAGEAKRSLKNRFHIPHRDIISQIHARMRAECPRPPPITPPRHKTKNYRCGDFTYEIPIEDTFTVNLFEQSLGLEKEKPKQPIYPTFPGVNEKILCQIPKRHTEEMKFDFQRKPCQLPPRVTTPSSPFLPTRSLNSPDGNPMSSKRRIMGVHELKPSPSLSKIQLNLTEERRINNDFGIGNIHQRLAQRNQRMKEVLQKEIPFSPLPPQHFQRRGNVVPQTHSNPRLAKFLEEIRKAKEKQQAR